jgi:DNA-binding beta-propeller fold protein YncE
MSRIRTIGRLAWILAGLASALLALSAVSPAAFAHRLPPPRASTRLPQAHTPIDTVATGSMQAALRGLGGVTRAGPGGRGGSVVLDGAPGTPVTNPKTGTVYVPIQCTTSSCTTPKHVVDVINAARCNAKVISGCKVVARAKVGRNPLAAAIDPGTDTVYVVNGDSNTVSVINGARCNARMTRGCGRPVAAVKVGKFPVAAALNPATRTLYVANLKGGSVSVINAARCNAKITQGCGRPPRTVTDKAGPDWIDVNVATDTVYAANSGTSGNGDTVSVIDGAACNGHTGRGCGRVPVTVRVGSNPFALAVDQASDTVYVANFVNEFDGGSVSVINGAACNGHKTAGCGLTPPAVPTGIGTGFVAVDGALHTVFAVNQDDNTLSAINTRTCDGTVTSGCRRRPPNQQTGPDRGPGFNPFPNAFALIPRTGTAYLVNVGGADILSVTSISRCNAIKTTGCRAEAPTVPNHEFLMTADPATNTLYAGNDNRRQIDVINGATCHAGQLAGCAPVTTIPMANSQANVGSIDHATHTLYASNPSSDTVAVINTATCNAQYTAGCAQHPPTVKVGPRPNAPVINPATETLYVSYRTGSRVAVVNAATCNATDTSGCGQAPAVVKVGAGAFYLAVSPATDTVYTAGVAGNTVAVINGATCNGTDHSGCGQLAATATVGSSPFGVAVNDRTHTVYVTNAGDSPGTVSVINSATCNGTRTAGCRRHFPTMTTGISPGLIAADTRTGMLYVNSGNSAAVTILNGSRCNAEVTSGCRAAGHQQAIGSGPQAIAVNPRTRTVYVSESYPPASPLSVFPTTRR